MRCKKEQWAKKEMANINKEATRSQIRFLLTGFYLDLYKLQNAIKVYDNNINLAKLLNQSLLTHDLTYWQNLANNNA